jgi:cysteine-S-conjugate beta-lyase
MTTYNFDEVIDRKNTDAIKTDRCMTMYGTEDLYPLWVADMDFRTPDFILDAIRERLNHPILGYSNLPKEFFPLTIQWIKDHHAWEVERPWIGYLNGIVPGIAFAVQVYAEQGDDVIIQPPVYYPFIHVVKNNDRNLVYNPLKEVDGRFEMDFQDLKQKITPRTKLIIISNPHNPGGRVWDKDTLRELASICHQHNIIVVSDEIHADMVLTGYQHTPFATVSDEAKDISATFMAPSKTFNIPGMVSSTYIIPNGELRRKFATFLQKSDLTGGNVLSYTATVAAYVHGENWRIQMLRYVEGNIQFLAEYLQKNIPVIEPMIPEASFLVWLDCKELGFENTDDLHIFFAQKGKLGLNKGTTFGPGGEQHLRINVACSRTVLKLALESLKKAVEERV